MFFNHPHTLISPCIPKIGLGFLYVINSLLAPTHLSASAVPIFSPSPLSYSPPLSISTLLSLGLISTHLVVITATAGIFTVMMPHTAVGIVTLIFYIPITLYGQCISLRCWKYGSRMACYMIMAFTLSMSSVLLSLFSDTSRHSDGLLQYDSLAAPCSYPSKRT